MTDHLTFECPHCKTPVEVKEELLGGNIDCPHCDHMFQAIAPVGRLLDPVDRSTGDNDGDHNEQILRTVRPVLFRQHLGLTGLCGVLVLFAVVGFVMAALGSPLLGMTGGVLVGASLVALLVATAVVLKWTLTMLGTTLTVTDHRTILRRGILSSKTSEVQHDDIRNIKSDRSTLERMFNYGDIGISSSGQDDFEIMVHDIPAPEGVLDIIRRHQSHSRRK